MGKAVYFASTIIRANLSQRPSTYKLTFIVTNRCNLKCTTCNIWKGGLSAELSTEDIRRFFTRNNRLLWINLSGGEIFMREDIVDIVRIINMTCKNIYFVNFPTNGFMSDMILTRTKEMLKFITHRLIITVSIDGDRETHDRQRGVKGSYDMAIETYSRLRGLRDRRLKVYLGLTISSINSGNFKGIIISLGNDIKDLSYADIHINLFHTSPHYYKNEALQLNKAEASDIFRYVKAMKSQIDPISLIEKLFMGGAISFLRYNKMVLPCKAIFSSCFVTPEGNVYPCSGFDAALGNLRNCNYDLAKILTSDMAKYIMGVIKEEGCPACFTPCEAYQTILGNILRHPMKVLSLFG